MDTEPGEDIVQLCLLEAIVSVVFLTVISSTRGGKWSFQPG